MGGRMIEIIRNIARYILHDELEQMRIQITKYREEIQSKENKIRSLKQNLTDIQSTVNQMTDQISELEQQVKQLKQLLHEQEEQIPDNVKQYFEQFKDVSGYVFKARRPKFCWGKKYFEWFDARQLFQIGDNRIIDICKEIDRQYHPKNLPDLFLAVFKWQAEKVKYDYDSSKWNTLDYWAYPTEVFIEKNINQYPKKWLDDCETKAFTTVSLLLNYKYVRPELEVPWWMVRVDLGMFYGSGHGWVVFLDPRDMETWRIYEATGRPPRSLNLRIANYTQKDNPYDMYYFITLKEVRVKRGNLPYFGGKMGKVSKDVLENEEYVKKLKQKKKKKAPAGIPKVIQEYLEMMKA